MSILSFLTIELAIALGIAAVLLFWLLGKAWRLLHNKYFWLIAIFSTGALAFAIYDMGHRQTLFNWLGISKSTLGWAYDGGKTAWQLHGDSVIAGWHTFIGFFITHPSIGYVVSICICLLVFSVLGIMAIGRFGIMGLKFLQRKAIIWGLKSLFASAVTVLLIELNLMIIDPVITNAVKSIIISQVGALTFSDTLKNMVWGAVKGMVYKVES